MSYIKNKLLEDIEKKIARRKEKKEAALDNKSYRAAVFDFFRNIEEAKKISVNSSYDREIANSALLSLKERLHVFDSKAQVRISWRDENNVAGVTIFWSNSFANAHNVEPSVYIDIGEMLLF